MILICPSTHTQPVVPQAQQTCVCVEGDRSGSCFCGTTSHQARAAGRVWGWWKARCAPPPQGQSWRSENGPPQWPVGATLLEHAGRSRPWVVGWQLFGICARRRGFSVGAPRDRPKLVPRRAAASTLGWQFFGICEAARLTISIVTKDVVRPQPLWGTTTATTTGPQPAQLWGAMGMGFREDISRT